MVGHSQEIGDFNGMLSVRRNMYNVRINSAIFQQLERHK